MAHAYGSTGTGVHWFGALLSVVALAVLLPHLPSADAAVSHAGDAATTLITASRSPFSGALTIISSEKCAHFFFNYLSNAPCLMIITLAFQRPYGPYPPFPTLPVFRHPPFFILCSFCS